MARGRNRKTRVSGRVSGAVEPQKSVNDATRNLELDLLYVRALVELLTVLVLEISRTEQRRLSELISYFGLYEHRRRLARRFDI